MTQSAWSAPTNVMVGTPAAPTITTASPLAGGNVGQAYSVQLDATGPGTIVWSIDSGAPPGLSINPVTGVLSGTPTTSGTYAALIVRATNSAGATTKTFSVAIGTSPVFEASIVTESLPTAVVGEAYSYQLSLAGTPTITVAASTLPAGWSCSSGGVLSNSNPGAAFADYSITFTPSNGLGAGTPKVLLLTCLAVAPASTTFRHITDRSGAGPFAKRRNR